MKISVVGRGNVGGGLARLWRAAGHEVEEIGKEGGDVSSADAVLVAVPAGAIEDALSRVTGLEGKVTIDATNNIRGERGDSPSLAHRVKSITGGPVAKAFNLNFARLYDEVAKQSPPPSMLYAADDDARDVVETLIRDAGYDPVDAGDLGNARALEDMLGALFAVSQTGGGQVFYRIFRP